MPGIVSSRRHSSVNGARAWSMYAIGLAQLQSQRIAELGRP